MRVCFDFAKNVSEKKPPLLQLGKVEIKKVFLSLKGDIINSQIKKICTIMITNMADN
jgi:hypothetical protein